MAELFGASPCEIRATVKRTALRGLGEPLNRVLKLEEACGQPISNGINNFVNRSCVKGFKRMRSPLRSSLIVPLANYDFKVYGGEIQ